MLDSALRRIANALSRSTDLMLAALVIGIVAMMVIPLPTVVLDILLATNISIAVVLLLIALYVADALRFATFPTLLLITTLFRLGLNVSSTRLILLQADAGSVIRSFGDFVVAGNLVVGAVVFLILTLIQFVVIAKGSERVAEVAARFTLDAMPGKQMAIDADVRAGTIDIEQARRMRSDLQRESQLYGSMDGAMKFVKGDAIAGILITLINIVGGLTIGVMQRGMALGDAAQVYSLLTIGDGLVSQIPALIISTAAGIVVTRVASEDKGAHLGSEIGRQILAQPRALAIAAGLLLVFALVPGLPGFPFFVLSAILATVAYLRMRRSEPATESSRYAGEDRFDAADGEDSLAMPSPVTIELGADLATALEVDSPSLTELIPGLREMVYSELGAILPGVQVRPSDEIPPAGYRLLLAEVPMGERHVDLGGALVAASPDRVAGLGISARPVELAGVGMVAEVGAGDDANRLADHGIARLGPATQITLHLGQVVRGQLREFVGMQEVQHLLDRLEQTHASLVHEVVPKLVSLRTLTEVLRRLVEEGVSIRPLREILESLAEIATVEQDPVALTEHVRVGLSRFITYKYSQGAGVIYSMTLGGMIEDTVQESIQRTKEGSFLAIEPAIAEDIVHAVRRHADAHPGAVIVTYAGIRRYVRRLIEGELPELPVIAFEELANPIEVETVARITVG